MEAPLCPICGQLNVGDHMCPKESWAGELKTVRHFYERNARIEWEEHLRNEEEKNSF
ncbi:MAG: hypothetical protein HOM47_01965, partial [Euryarchaeota archaeon]|nr:hypothetical protein [Euryarchaeota archaeon]